ncbi:MAG: EipA family protein, partial [Gammaproteobacteria bacterium]
VFVLVYNLPNAETIFQRFPAIDGSFYWIGGVGANYHQVDDIVLAPMRLGVGLRAGVNIGYMHYKKKKSWNPF